MKRVWLLPVAFSLLLAVLSVPFGCGAGGTAGDEAEVVDFAIREILVPKEQGRAFIVAWLRESTGPSDVSFDALAQRFWKWEGGVLAEIDAQEYQRLSGAGQDGGGSWAYSQHSVTVREYDAGKGEAVVEIGSMYGPMTMAGTRYLLRKEEGSWKKVSEETVWMN